MDKEKILEAARKNKRKGQEVENKVTVRGSLWGSFAAFVVGICLFLLEYFVRNTVNIGLLIVGMIALGVQSLYEGIKNKKVPLIVIGIVQSIVSVLAVFVFVGQVVAL